MPKFGFVILHYNALDMTKECIGNILNLFNNKDIIIVIVDNASPNGSGKALKHFYSEQQKIRVILHHKNDGFARGNNIGFNYLKNNYNIDFMIVMNNDVIIKQADFLNKIERIYNKHNFGVLGPDIYAPKLLRHQNPLDKWLTDINTCENFIHNYKKMLRRDTLNHYRNKLLHYTVYWWAKPLLHILMPQKYNQLIKTKKVKPQRPDKSQIYEQNNIEDCMLQGSCLIFSKEFIQKRQYAFYPDTFLYYEEHILCLQCRHEKLKMLYSPEIKVVHNCYISTEETFSEREAYRLYWRENIKSIKEYIKLYKQYNINA